MVEEALRFLESLTTMSEEEVKIFFLGKGSTREAYKFKGTYIIKIPRFVVRFEEAEEYSKEQTLNIIKNGVKQTETEVLVYNSCREEHKYLLNPIVGQGYFLNMPFIVMPLIKIASKTVPFDIYNIKSFIEYMDLCVPKNFYKDLETFSVAHGLYLDDLVENMDNFGLDNSNRVLVSDYGTYSY